jgi:hypothetical protein
VQVYVDDNDGRRLIGRADVPEDAGPVLAVPMVGAAAPSIVESFAIGAVTHLPAGGGAPVVERVVLAASGLWLGALAGWVCRWRRGARRGDAAPGRPNPPVAARVLSRRTRSRR